MQLGYKTILRIREVWSQSALIANIHVTYDP